MQQPLFVAMLLSQVVAEYQLTVHVACVGVPLGGANANVTKAHSSV